MQLSFLGEPSALEPHVDKSLIILLDLNYTLVGNSLEKRGGAQSYRDKILAETYREWLIELVRGHTVLLCTVRHVRFRGITLDHIQQLTGWQPDESYFNPDPADWRGNTVKRRYLDNAIFPKYGKPDAARYFAIESATATKVMYTAAGIQSASVGAARWTKLPCF